MVYTWVRDFKDDFEIKTYRDENICIKEAYKDYEEQFSKYYEDGAYSPCDNFNEKESFESFKARLLKDNKAGLIFTSRDNFVYRFKSCKLI